jgi:hypothetical protein
MMIAGSVPNGIREAIDNDHSGQNETNPKQCWSVQRLLEDKITNRGNQYDPGSGPNRVSDADWNGF